MAIKFPLARHAWASQRWYRALLLFAALGMFSCAGEPTLQGSLGELVPLAYDTAKLTLDGELQTLEFLKARGTGQDTVLKLTLLTSGLPANPVVFDLAEKVEAGGARCIVTRHVFEDPNDALPPIARGQLTFKSVPTKGATVEGTFSASFEQGSDFGAGRTVSGSFSAGVAP